MDNRETLKNLINKIQTDDINLINDEKTRNQLNNLLGLVSKEDTAKIINETARTHSTSIVHLLVNQLKEEDPVTKAQTELREVFGNIVDNPDIDINYKDSEEHTPFEIALAQHKISAIIALSSNPNLDFDEAHATLESKGHEYGYTEVKEPGKERQYTDGVRINSYLSLAEENKRKIDSLSGNIHNHLKEGTLTNEDIDTLNSILDSSSISPTIKNEKLKQAFLLNREDKKTPLHTVVSQYTKELNELNEISKTQPSTNPAVIEKQKLVNSLKLLTENLVVNENIDVNALDARGENPVFSTVNNPEVFEIFQENSNVDYTQENIDGKTILDIATENKLPQETQNLIRNLQEPQIKAQRARAEELLKDPDLFKNEETFKEFSALYSKKIFSESERADLVNRNEVFVKLIQSYDEAPSETKKNLINSIANNPDVNLNQKLNGQSALSIIAASNKEETTNLYLELIINRDDNINERLSYSGKYKDKNKNIDRELTLEEIINENIPVNKTLKKAFREVVELENKREEAKNLFEKDSLSFEDVEKLESYFNDKNISADFKNKNIDSNILFFIEQSSKARENGKNNIAKKIDNLVTSLIKDNQYNINTQNLIPIAVQKNNLNLFNAIKERAGEDFNLEIRFDGKTLGEIAREKEEESGINQQILDEVIEPSKRLIIKDIAKLAAEQKRASTEGLSPEGIANFRGYTTEENIEYQDKLDEYLYVINYDFENNDNEKDYFVENFKVALEEEDPIKTMNDYLKENKERMKANNAKIAENDNTLEYSEEEMANIENTDIFAELENEHNKILQENNTLSEENERIKDRIQRIEEEKQLILNDYESIIENDIKKYEIEAKSKETAKKILKNPDTIDEISLDTLPVLSEEIVTQALEENNIELVDKVLSKLPEDYNKGKILDKAVSKGKHDFIKHLMEEKEIKPTALSVHKAIKSGNIELTNYLINKGAPVVNQVYKGRTVVNALFDKFKEDGKPLNSRVLVCLENLEKKGVNIKDPIVNKTSRFNGLTPTEIIAQNQNKNLITFAERHPDLLTKPVVESLEEYQNKLIKENPTSITPEVVRLAEILAAKNVQKRIDDIELNNKEDIKKVQPKATQRDIPNSYKNAKGKVGLYMQETRESKPEAQLYRITGEPGDPANKEFNGVVIKLTPSSEMTLVKLLDVMKKGEIASLKSEDVQISIDGGDFVKLSEEHKPPQVENALRLLCPQEERNKLLEAGMEIRKPSVAPLPEITPAQDPSKPSLIKTLTAAIDPKMVNSAAMGKKPMSNRRIPAGAVPSKY